MFWWPKELNRLRFKAELSELVHGFKSRIADQDLTWPRWAKNRSCCQELKKRSKTRQQHKIKIFELLVFHAAWMQVCVSFSLQNAKLRPPWTALLCAADGRCESPRCVSAWRCWIRTKGTWPNSGSCPRCGSLGFGRGRLKEERWTKESKEKKGENLIYKG